jgi:hypothetical protein
MALLKADARPASGGGLIWNIFVRGPPLAEGIACVPITCN